MKGTVPECVDQSWVAPSWKTSRGDIDSREAWKNGAVAAELSMWSTSWILCRSRPWQRCKYALRRGLRGHWCGLVSAKLSADLGVGTEMRLEGEYFDLSSCYAGESPWRPSAKRVQRTRKNRTTVPLVYWARINEYLRIWRWLGTSQKISVRCISISMTNTVATNPGGRRWPKATRRGSRTLLRKDPPFCFDFCNHMERLGGGMEWGVGGNPKLWNAEWCRDLKLV